MSKQREIMVALAQSDDVNIAQLARNFKVSRKTIYKWRNRARKNEGIESPWSLDQSRRPASCPWQTSQDTQQAIVQLRQQYPCWGPRKLRHLLLQNNHPAPPSASTIAAILKRCDLVDKEQSAKRQPFIRFERSQPNDLWQMDFKGPFKVGMGRCHPLTVVDDHSRFGLGVVALGGESGELTRPALTQIFRLYGLPQCMLLDNGSCWGRIEASYTAFTAWLLRLGIRVIYARPYHPQTKGKNERFNRTLKAEAMGGQLFGSLEDCQKRFDQFLLTYNTIRPHQALDMAVPASRYQVSVHEFPEHLPQIEYLEDDLIRKVGPVGFISWNKQRFHVGRAFIGDPVAIRPTRLDGIYEVYYCYQRIAIIDRHTESCKRT